MGYTTANDYWVYNDKNLNVTDTAIAVSKKKFAAAVNMKKICLRRSLLISTRAGPETLFIVKCHMPTKWKSPKEYTDTVEELRAA